MDELEKPGMTLFAKTADNKIWVQSTPRPIGTFTSFSSEGDNQSNPLQVGGGQKVMIHHEVGQPLEQPIYLDFNVKENRTFISEGFALFEACSFDEIKLSIVPKVTPYIVGTNTTFNLYGGFLILPAAGDGNIIVNPADIQLVEIPFSVDDPTIRQSPTYWDADYDVLSHTFSNLRPNLTGQGQYNIFGAEIQFEVIVRIILLRHGMSSLHTSDIAEFAHGMRAKITFTTHEPDHEWKACVNLTLNRQHTC
jgi:hypothetical protein